jgi:ubiquinone/menaquinone biosynthesis C-methylase UbiE
MNENPLADYFDQCAEEGIFDGFSIQELPVVQEILDRMTLHPGDRIVEPGCGSGRLTEMLASLVGPEGKVLSFDISPKMVEQCLARKLPQNVEILRSGGEKLPAEDESFDAVICVNAFPHFENRDAALREFHRILRSNGVLWIAHTRSREWVNSLHSSSDEVIRTHLLPTENEFEVLLRENGFSLEFLDDLPDRYLLKATIAARGSAEPESKE